MCSSQKLAMPKKTIQLQESQASREEVLSVGPLHDPVTWYKIKYTGEQVAQWDFQNKGRSRWTGTSCFVLEVPLCNLLTSIFNFVPCDRIVQRAHWPKNNRRHFTHSLKPNIDIPLFSLWA